jgi:uncharacterized membrane protein YbaN (DUF454 family)/ubiquinone/menaquinone biosynthesis C-methylase UbiE
LAAGTLSTAVGIVGIFVPILPTTPFLLLAAACYLRSSERFYRWLVHNKILGAYIRDYLEGGGMALRAKLFTLALLWATIGVTVAIGTDNTAIRIVLGVVAVGVTAHIVRIKTKKKEAVPLETGNDLTTEEVFDAMAPSWYNFRHRTIFRRELEEMAGRWRGGKLLNVGCGHGPDFLPFKEGFELFGVDVSGRMLALAGKYAEKYNLTFHLVRADARHLPYQDGSFDYALAIATFHHIEGEEERLKALGELGRVLKPGGEAFITVWNRWQPRFWLKKKDIRVPWKMKDKTLYRNYHLFSYGELEKLVKKAGLTLVKSFPEKRYNFPVKLFSRNVCLLVRKT